MPAANLPDMTRRDASLATSELPKRRGPRRPKQPLPKTGSRATSDPNRVAPQSKLTAELAERIFAEIRVGNRIDVAAKVNGVATDTLMTWMRKGREATRGLYHDLCVGVDEAVAHSERRDLATIDAASSEQWTAAAWKLERRYPDVYGRKTRLEGQVDVRGVPYLDTGKLDADELEQLARLLRKAAPGQDELPRDGRPALELVSDNTR